MEKELKDEIADEEINENMSEENKFNENEGAVDDADVCESCQKSEKKSEKGSKKGVTFKVKHLKFLTIIAVLVLIAGFVLITSFPPASSSTSNNSQTQSQEPLEVQLITITHLDCANNSCVSLDPLVSELKNVFSTLNVTVSNEEILVYGSSQAKELIEKYAIKKLPVLIVSGDTNKIPGLQDNWVSLNYGSKETDNALVVRSQLPVYFDLTNNSFKGAVKMITLTDIACTDCAPVIGKDKFALLNIKVTEEKSVDVSTPEGQELVAKYNITKVPTVILSKDLKDYENYASLLEVASEESDGSFVFREVTPLYFDLSLGKVVGNVFMVYIVDTSCKECYSAELLQKSLKDAFGLKAYQEDIIEYNSTAAISLIQKYDISKIPSVILVGDIDAYYLLKNAWQNLGTVGNDGVYVFTNLQALGKGAYKDLSNDQIVTVS